jgi:O-antigen/teichoic acid export membrane protein
MADATDKYQYSVFGRQVGYVVAVNIAILVLSVVEIPIITKALGASQYGVWSLISVTISLLVPFAALSLGIAVVRFLAVEHDRVKLADDFFSAGVAVFLAGLALAIGLFFAAKPLAIAVLGTPSAAQYIELASILIVLNALYQLGLGFIRMRREIGLYTALSAIERVARVGAIVVLLSLGLGLTGVVMGVIASALLMSLLALGLVIHRTGFHMPHFTHLDAYLRWGLPLTPNVALLWIIQVSDRYMVSYFLGTTAAGIYSAAYSIGNYAQFALMPLGTVLFPYVVRTYKLGDTLTTQKYFKHGHKYLMMVSIPAAVALSVLARPILETLTTPDFAAGSGLVSLVASSAVVYSVYKLRVYVLHITNRTHLIARLLGFAALLNIGLNLLLIPRSGIVGAAIATLVAYTVLGILTVFVTRHDLRYNLSPLFIAKSVLASSVMAGAIRLAAPHSLQTLLASIPLGVAVYVGVLLLLRAVSRAELQFFGNLARDVVHRVRPPS